MEHYKLVIGDKTIEITRPDFEAARGDRDELFQQLETESWFAEVRTAVISWLEGLLRFAARMDPVAQREFVRIQTDCESTSRMGAVLIATHGLRPRINQNHDDCPCSPACTIAWTLRDSCAHRTTRLFNTTSTFDDLWLKGSQIDRMPVNGNRHAFELRVQGGTLLEQAGKSERRNLQKAVAELFPSGDIDVIAVMNRHIACVNRSMAAYRSKVQDPVASRNELLARFGFTGKPMVYIRHGTEDKIWLGEPFDQMLDDRNRLRQEHHKAPIFELIQFGRGECRAGSLEEARDYTIALLADRGLSSWKTEEAAAALDLDSGYPGEALCKDAPPLFEDAVERLYQRAQEAATALRWPGHTLRVLPARLRGYEPKA